MSKQIHHLYAFGEFRLDEAERLLLHDGKPVALTPKAFETLLVLIQRGGHLVEKNELMKQVWADAFVEEANLARNIWTLRKALGDDEGEHRYIETVPKVGYRFVAPVTQLPNEPTEVLLQRRVRARIVTEEESSDGAALVPTSPSPIARPITGQRKNHRTAILVGLAICALVAISIIAAIIVRNARSSETARTIDSVAVLPFANTSGDPELEYLSDGITENLINRLAQVPRLKMIARSSVFHYKGKEIDPQKVGRELGVQAILIGRVVQHGDNLSVSAELVDVRDNSHLWGENYDRRAADLMALQKELAQDIADSLRLRFTSEEQRRIAKSYTENVEAYQLYLKGRYFWNKRDEAGLKKGIQYFQQAVNLDHGYALAYAGLADCYLLLYEYEFLTLEDSMPQAKAATAKALELDETLAEVHTSLAYLNWLDDRDWAGSEKEFLRALALNPNYATARLWYGRYLTSLGRFDEAIEEMKHAQEIDPLSPVIGTNLGESLYFSRRYDRAIEQLNRTLEIEPKFALAHWFLGFVYGSQHRYEGAIAEYQRALASEGDPELAAAIGETYRVGGYEAAIRKVVDAYKDRAKQDGKHNYDIASFLAAIGEKDQAFDWLEKAYQKHHPWLIYLKVDPLLDNLRSDPRFDNLVSRVGFPP